MRSFDTAAQEGHETCVGRLLDAG
eukprot:COSAG02_NODE_65532_length_258_cov_0.377358_1_plen_23_part_10